MKLTRRRFLVGSVVAVALMGGAWFAFAEHEPREPPFGVTRSAYRAIQMGMTVKDVEHLVGEPVVPIRLLGSKPESEDKDDFDLGPAKTCTTWWIDGGTFEVYFNQEGLVCGKSFYSPTLLERLLRQVRDFWGKLVRSQV